MKRKAWIIGVLLAILCVGLVEDADAHRRGYRRGYGPRYRQPRMWVAPPPPVIVITPRYGYRPRHHYARPRHHGYYGRPYAHRGYGRRW